MGKPNTRSKTKKRSRKNEDEEKEKEEKEKKFLSLVSAGEEEIVENGENLLEGLTFSRDGKHVKVDENLLRRLRTPSELEVQVVHKNPFEDCPIFLETIQKGTPLSMEFLQECSNTFRKNSGKVANMPLDWIGQDRSEMQQDIWEYNVKVSGTPKITDQQSVGYCWVYSANNILRRALMSKFSLEHKFELSPTYIFFYDKIERSNLFLEYMWQFRNYNLQDREVRMFTNPSGHFLSDGGLFTFYTNLVSKYGIIPENMFTKCLNSSTSNYINEVLTTVLNNMALEIFRNKDSLTREKFETLKTHYNKTIYDLVVRFLGTPPKPNDNFDWRYRDEHGVSHKVPNLTPLKFYRTIISHEHDTKITIINDPRHPETYFQKSYSEYSLNMQGGAPVTMINFPMDVFKKTVCESLKNDEAVWMACDIGRALDMENKTSDTKRYNYKKALGTEVEFSKSEMLEMLTSTPSHAMVFIGVDTNENSQGEVLGYNNWRVENSWGNDSDLEMCQDSGFFRMSDDYVDKYVYMAVVDLKYLEQDVMQKIVENAQNTYTYKYTDAFGTVAKSCSHCMRHDHRHPNKR